MGQDFGVGLRPQDGAGGGQLFPQPPEVFNDPVVHHRKRIPFVQVGMGVGVGGGPVGGPAGVSHAQGARQRPLVQEGRQPVHFAFGFPHPQFSAADGGDARRVVTPVFQPPQSVQNHFLGRAGADVSHNSAHRLTFRWGMAHLKTARSGISGPPSPDGLRVFHSGPGSVPAVTRGF